MALIHADFVEETTTTTGTGTLSLDGATIGSRTFVSAIGNGNTCIYGIATSDYQFESGIGTITDATPDTLERTTLLSSSTGSKLDLPAGTHRVYCTFAGEGGTKAYAAEAVTAAITPAAKTVLDDTTVSAMVDTLGGAASTGSGGLVRTTSPTLVTPALGIPASGNLVNCTGISDTGKNRIINGGFRINQRGVSGTVTLVAYAFGLDRWQAVASGCTYTFATVNGLTTLNITAGSLRQVIESINVPAGVNQCTLSWIGTAQGKIGAGSFAASPIIASVTGGNVQVIEFSTGTLANVQFELGSVATPFSPRLYSTEELLCKRYYQQIGGEVADDIVISGNAAYAGVIEHHSFVFPVSMYAIPSVTSPGAWVVANSSQPTVGGISRNGFVMTTSSLAAGNFYATSTTGSTGGHWNCSAEV